MVNPLKQLDDRPIYTTEEVLARSQSRGEHLGLTKLRRDALNYYLRTELPDRVRHLWRYSDPKLFLPEASAAVYRDSHYPTEIFDVAEDGGILLRPNEPPISILTTEAEEAGVEVAPLGQSDRGIARLNQTVTQNHGLLESLNTALWSSGVMVRIPRGAILSEPLWIRCRTTDDLSALRLVVVVEEGASASIIEDHGGGGKNRRLLSISEIFVAPGARLNYALNQQWRNGTTGHITSRAVLQRDATLQTAIVSLGGAHYKLDIGAQLAGKGASSELFGVALGDGRQQMDHHTVHHHAAPDTNSNIHFKVALGKRARSAYTGLIRIDNDAARSEAYQETRNLLLSRRAHADTIPELEILTNDVRCTHGATSAPVDPSQIFYLMSRGLNRSEATKLVIRGFFEDVLNRAPDSLRPVLDDIVNQKLSALVQEGGTS